MPVVNVIQARNNLFNIVGDVQNGEKVIITSKNGTAAIMGEATYNSLVETLHLLSDPDIVKDTAEARKTPSEEMKVWHCPPTKSE